LDVTLPNKLFEYIACGLPVLSFPHRTQKTFIDEHRVGFVFHNIEELVELLNTDLVHEIRETVLKKRRDFTIEENIRAVKDFYENILNSKKEEVMRAHERVKRMQKGEINLLYDGVKYLEKKNKSRALWAWMCGFLFPQLSKPGQGKYESYRDCPLS
jgi:hypothetical protein